MGGFIGFKGLKKQKYRGVSENKMDNLEDYLNLCYICPK
jgi:hypothetical protein